MLPTCRAFRFLNGSHVNFPKHSRAFSASLPVPQGKKNHPTCSNRVWLNLNPNFQFRPARSNNEWHQVSFESKKHAVLVVVHIHERANDCGSPRILWRRLRCGWAIEQIVWVSSSHSYYASCSLSLPIFKPQTNLTRIAKLVNLPLWVTLRPAQASEFYSELSLLEGIHSKRYFQARECGLYLA